jgi:ATP-dependent phosphofructokinase / diphosphate-dependent phosphofructokinase
MPDTKPAILYAQSGGVTAVINATANGVIDGLLQYKDSYQLIIAQNGILGVLDELLIDAGTLDEQTIRSLYYLPSSAFGSCRYRLPDFDQPGAIDIYTRIFTVLAAHQIEMILYNGGNDSQDTLVKLINYSQKIKYPLRCIGIPKTIDNDLYGTDTCPGFGSAAKYVATATLEASMDIKAMASNSTKVFILETMGRHAGWLAAASSLARSHPEDPPHIILCPEVSFDIQAFLNQVNFITQRTGYCVIVASEGIKGLTSGNTHATDAFGHQRLAGVAEALSDMIEQKLQLKTHTAKPDYCLRSARHLAAKIDLEQSYELGKKAVQQIIDGESETMLTIVRTSDQPYNWEIGTIALGEVANLERQVPNTYIADHGMDVTQTCTDFLRPLIQGEDHPPYQNGIPMYQTIQYELMSKQCAEYTIPS